MADGERPPRGPWGPERPGDDGEASLASTHERYARVPGRSLESRYRYWSHRFPAGFRAAYFLGFVSLAVSTHLFPALLLAGVGIWLDKRANRAFELLAMGQLEASEQLALEEAERELPGPVADEYFTVAAVARALQGDAETTRDHLERREGPTPDLQVLGSSLLRPLGAVALLGIGEAEAALDLLGDLDPEKEDAPLCLTHAGILLSAARYRRSQEILEVVMRRFTSPAAVRETHALLLRLARETWDPEVEKLLPGFQPQSEWEAEVQLSSRLFLAEIQGRAHDAEMVSKKLMQLRCQQAKVEFSEDFFLWRDSLKSAQLHAGDLQPRELEAVLERSEGTRNSLEPGEQENIEGRYLEAWLEVCVALETGREEDALLPDEEDRLLGFSGGVLGAGRVLTLAIGLGDPSEAARELLRLRGLFRELPALEACVAAGKVLRGTPLEDADRFALRRANFALRLFPPGIARYLAGLPQR